MEEKEVIEGLIRRKGIPELKELVVIKVKDFTPYGVFCELIEYENIKGFIPLTEVSRKRIKKITEALKKGQITVGRVIEVKEDKEVDVSLRRVDENEKKRKLSEYRLEKRIANIFYIAAKNSGIKYEELKFFVDYLLEKYGSLQNFVESYRKKGDSLFREIKLDISEKFKEELIKEINRYVGRLKEKVSGILKIYSLDKYGAKKIKEALINIKENLSKVEDVSNLEIEYKSSPEWYLFFEVGKRKKKAIKEIKEKIMDLSKKYSKEGIYIELSI